MEARKAQMWTKVQYFQRFFVQGRHSGYFKVRQPRRTAQQQSEVDISQRIEEEIQGIIEAGRKAKEDADKVVEGGRTDEVNRWLDRTKWDKYLAGFEFQALMDLIERPDESDGVEYAIWKAMDSLGRYSQRTVEQKAGLFVRFEAIRSEKHQTRYQPLLGYQNDQTFTLYVRPWQQILMFFARTRMSAVRKESPRYRLTKQQIIVWERFLAMAKNEAAQQEEQEPGRSRQPSRPRRRQRRFNEDDSEEEETGQEAEEQKELTGIQKACLEFCIALLNCKHQNGDYDSAMVCALAILGVDDAGWKGVDRYPPILSRIIKISRFLVVQQAWEEVQPPDEFGANDEGYESDSRDYGEVTAARVDEASIEIEHEVDDVASQIQSIQDDGDSAISVEPPESRVGVIDVVRRMMDGFMVRGTNGPMQWMLDLRTYGLKIHYNTTAEGHVQWSGEDKLTYKGLEVEMNAFRGFVHALVQQAHEQMREKLLMGFEPPTIPWQSMRDDASETKSRFNFLKSEEWVNPVDSERWLWGQIQSNTEQASEWFDDETGHIQRGHMTDYMDAVEEFRMQLLILMHMTGGQPARAPEILSIRHENTPRGGHRNLFLEDGLVVYITQYHKGYSMSGDIKIIHRYLPREVGELLVYYLWLVLPFQFAIERKFWWTPTEPSENNTNEEASNNSSGDVSSSNVNASGSGSGTIQARPSRNRRAATNTAQPGVSSHLWPASYRGQKITSPRMREALKRYSRLHLGQSITIAAYREIAIAISRMFLSKGHQFEPDHDNVDEEAGEDGEASVGKRLQAIIDKQAGHTSHIAGMIYARLMQEMKGSVASVREGFRTASRIWHMWLGFTSAEDAIDIYNATKDKKRKLALPPWEEAVQQRRRAREKLLNTVDIHQELRRMFPKDVTFRGVQEQAMRAIVRGDPRIVVVMPTGEGKSILFQLPAFIAPSGITIVVVPLVQLRFDMMDRCKKLNIIAREWEATKQVDDATMLFVTPEAAAKQAFQRYVNRNRHRMDRIVVDECHVILNRGSRFRRELQRLGHLVRCEAQMLLVTATLPPSEQDELYRRMFWEGLQVNDECRMRTVRWNIRYAVHVVEKSGNQRRDRERHDEAVVKIAAMKLRQHYPGKVIIYANSIGKVRGLAEQLGVDEYFSEVDLKSDKYEDFRSGRNQMIVATNALGLGIDDPNVRVVIHADMPRNLKEYVQESGRAGRDREFSEAITVVLAGEVAYMGQHAEFDQPETRALVERFVQSERPEEKQECRRKVLCEYFDGYAREGCEEGEQSCDICMPLGELTRIVEMEESASTPSPVEPSSQADVITGVQSSRGPVEVTIAPEDVERSSRLQQQRQQPQRQRQETVRAAEDELEAFKRRVREWHQRCVVCEVKGNRPAKHSVWGCSDESAEAARKVAKQVQQGVVMEEGAGCRQCLLPHSMCPKYQCNERGMWMYNRTVKCRHNGVMIGNVVGAMHAQKSCQMNWRAHVGALGVTEEQAEDWTRDSKVMRAVGRKKTLNEESVCEFAVVFSGMMTLVESWLERRKVVQNGTVEALWGRYA
jgi:RecQ family ATP-dependent DNA helicase